MSKNYGKKFCILFKILSYYWYNKKKHGEQTMNKILLIEAIRQSNLHPTTKSFLNSVIKNGTDSFDEGSANYPSMDQVQRVLPDDEIETMGADVDDQDWGEDFFLYGNTELQPEDEGYAEALNNYKKQARLPAYLRRQVLGNR